MLRSLFNVSKESEMNNFFSKYIKKNEPKIYSDIENNVLFAGDDYFFKSLTSNVKTYFEYGCGKSTEYMYNNSNASIFSVDTSKEWALKTLNLSKVSENNRLNIKWIDVGDVVDWGYPISFAKKKKLS